MSDDRLIYAATADERALAVAVVYNADGTVYDRCYTWEAGQSYALHEGRRVEAVADDRDMSAEDAQRLYDAELAAHVDCWGGPLYRQGGDS